MPQCRKTASRHHLTTRDEASGGFDALFRALRGPAPNAPDAHVAIRRLLADQGCAHRLGGALGRLSDPRNGLPMAYALSWISVAGGDSVMPPWARLQFPQAGLIVWHLRGFFYTTCPKCPEAYGKNNVVGLVETSEAAAA